jgi:fibronectin type 3 domain-containing protein
MTTFSDYFPSLATSRSAKRQGPWQLLTRPQLADTLYTDTALAPGQPHRYRVTAVDAAGQESSPSAEATVDVPPRAGPAGHRY